MGNLYILMGDTNTRKSSTICALTGFTRSKNPLDIRLDNEDIKEVFVIVSSAQERQDGFFDKINKIEQEGHEWDILLALWPDDRASCCIMNIPEVNRQEVHIIPLGANILPDVQQTLTNMQLPNLNIYQAILPDPALGRMPPTNEIAHHVRDRFGWL
jgi:hypothetical protein